jgi:O-antigen/teichoic acid export membrane protein
VLLVFAAEPLILLLAWVKESYLEFLPAAAVFKPLFLAGLVSVATIPIQTALYAARLPHVETYVELGTVVILIGGSLLLIPRYGSVGAAMAVLAQRTTAGVILVVWGLVKLRRMP